MERSEQLKWCESCKLRKPTLELGLICSVTGRIAEFEKTCPVFEIDTKAFQDNFRQSFQNDDRHRFRELRGEVYSTAKTQWRKYNSPEQLPDVFEIKNSWYGGRALFYVLMLPVFFGVLFYIDPAKLKSMLSSPLTMVFIFLPFALIPLLTIRSILDRKPKITLFPSGIQLGQGPFLDWKNTATVIVEDGNDSPAVSLVVKHFDQEPIEIQLQQLEYRPARISHLVELYKERGLASGA